MKKIFVLPLLILTACVSQTVEKIQSDPENIQKANSVRQRVDAGINAVINERKNDTKYQTCIKNVKTLNELKNKNSLSRVDMAKIFEIWPYEDTGFYWDWFIDDFDCSIESTYENKALEQEIRDFCYDKYWRGNWFTATTLFPLRMTNELLTIGTLGIFPTITGSCSAKDVTFFTMGENGLNHFGPYCWKPGATWNYDMCKKYISGSQHSYYWNQSYGSWSEAPDNNEKIQFTDEDVTNLKEKMHAYCKNPPQLNPYANKLCKGDYTKGCLIDLDGVSVATFGTRGNGVIVSARLWGLELTISDQVFVYDNRDYYDGQDLKTDGYYYAYVGNYDSGLQKLPAFKRSQYKVYKESDTVVEKWCDRHDRY